MRGINFGKYAQFGVVVLLCLQMGFVSHVYHAGYVHGQSNWDKEIASTTSGDPCTKDRGILSSEGAKVKNVTIQLKSSSELKQKVNVLENVTKIVEIPLVVDGINSPTPNILSTDPPATSAPPMPSVQQEPEITVEPEVQPIIVEEVSSTPRSTVVETPTRLKQPDAKDSADMTTSNSQFSPAVFKGTASEHAARLLAAREARNAALNQVRDFRKSPIIFYRNEDVVHQNCDVGCHERPGKNRLHGLVFLPDENRDGLMVDKFTIAQTMESGVNYPAFQIETLRKSPVVDIISTTSLQSHVPAVYGSWHMFNITEELDLRTHTRENAAVAFVSNCQSKFRMDAMEGLRTHGIPVHNFGNCQRTHRENSHRNKQASKTDTIRNYKFCLAFENSQEEDYVTEKLWQCIAHGGLTLILGPPNAMDYAPKGKDSIIYVSSLDMIPEIAQRMHYLIDHDDEYRKAMSWKHEGPSESFVALLDLDNVHGTCRSCIHAADRLVREAEKQIGAPHNKEEWGLCMIKDDASGTTTYLVDVRERGTFYFYPVLLTQDQLTVQGLHEAIRLNLESHKHVPTFKQIPPHLRKDWFGKDGHLHVYKVYPYTANQRQALYGEAGITDNEKVRNAVTTLGPGGQCPKLEVVLI